MHAKGNAKTLLRAVFDTFLTAKHSFFVCFTCMIFTIRYLGKPISNNSLTFLVFLDNFNFLDCAEKGRPKRFPFDLTFSNDAFVRCDIKLRSISADERF